MNGWGRGSEPSTDCTFFFWFYPLRSSIYLCLNFVAESNKIANSSQLIIVLTTLWMPLTTFPFLTCHSPPTFFLCSPPPIPLHLSLKSKSFFFNLCRCDCNLMTNSLKDYFFSSINQSIPKPKDLAIHCTSVSLVFHLLQISHQSV